MYCFGLALVSLLFEVMKRMRERERQKKKKEKMGKKIIFP